MEKKLSIGRIGWEEENNLMAIVCIDKKTRDELGKTENVPVKVLTKANKVITGSCIAFVGKIHKDLVGKEKAGVNTVLANKLGLDNGSDVFISTEITESEDAEFKRELQSIMFMGQ